MSQCEACGSELDDENLLCECIGCEEEYCMDCMDDHASECSEFVAAVNDQWGPTTPAR